MRNNGFNGGSFVIGLLIGFVLLAILFFAVFYGSNRPANTVYYTPTPEVQGTQPVVPVTGQGESPNPVRNAVDYFFQQFNLKIVQPFLAWLNSRPIQIQTRTTPEPNDTPLIIVTPTP